ncbi:transcriptional regulator [Cronobacter dublinensis]
MKDYWNTLSAKQKAELAKKVGSSTGYLRLVFKGHKKAGFQLCQKLEEETAGAISKNELRPDIYPNSQLASNDNSRA